MEGFDICGDQLGPLFSITVIIGWMGDKVIYYPSPRPGLFFGVATRYVHHCPIVTVFVLALNALINRLLMTMKDRVSSPRRTIVPTTLCSGA